MSANKKILIIEDDIYTREVYEEVLKEAGYDIETAMNGEEGLSKAQNGTYDLILLDMMMPKMDGLQFLEAFSKTPAKAANQKIILLTNLSQDPVIAEALKRGATDYMIKSDLNPDQLVAYVTKFLE